jgi:sulfite exporter TauE/SafE
MLGSGGLLALAAAGLASGVHCLGMCGGIASLSGLAADRRVIPIRPASPEAAATTRGAGVARVLAMNAGRIATYTLAGAIAGSLGSAGAYASGALAAQALLMLIANLMLIAIGLYLAGAVRLLAPLEALGRPLWRRVQPLAVRLMSAPGTLNGLLAGLVWGWLPCGLVYAALGVAVFAGSPAGGALGMLAFGLGTLPTLLAAGFAFGRLRGFLGRPLVRYGVATLVLGFGVAGLARAQGVADALQSAILCFS